jgi:hypothetical protein
MLAHAVDEALDLIEHLSREIRMPVAEQAIQQHEDVAQAERLDLTLGQGFLCSVQGFAEVSKSPERVDDEIGNPQVALAFAKTADERLNETPLLLRRRQPCIECEQCLEIVGLQGRSLGISCNALVVRRILFP